MSHDLEFRARGTSPDPAAIERYFDEHPWITPDPTDPRVERYFHPTTEVTLRYERFDVPAEDRRLGVGFTVDYLAPHVVANEAVDEIRRFAKQFDLDVIDLCNLDGPDGPDAPLGSRPVSGRGLDPTLSHDGFDERAFLESYDRGNSAAYRVHFHPERQGESSSPRYTLPSDALAAIWRWNSEVADHDEAPVIVPAITCLELFGVVQSATTWIAPEDLPTGQRVRLPAVDLLIVTDARRDDRTPTLVPLGDVACPREWTPDLREGGPRLATTELTEADIGAYTLPDLAPLASSPWVTVPFRAILDREWVDALRGAT